MQAELSADQADATRPRGTAPAVAFSTRSLPPAQQFDAWRENCGAVVELFPPAESAQDYQAAFKMWSFGHFALSAVQAPAARFQRSARHIRRDDLDHWMVHVARRGSQTLQSGDAATAVGAGRPHILSLDRPLDGARSEIDWLCLFVARDAFPAFGPTFGPAFDACRDQPLEPAMGGLLVSYLEGLAAALPGMPAANLPGTAEATRAVIAACIGPGLPASPEAEQHVERARLARARQIIRQNLGSSRFGPARLCKLAGMSRSQLYRLFEPFGGVARAIQAERLSQANRALSDPEDRREIIRIAEDCGFFDASGFSRAFRREFGHSPSEARLIALATGAPASIRRARCAQPPRDFVSALRQL